MAQIDKKQLRIALEQLKKGDVPLNYETVEQYMTGNALELFDYAAALSDCVKRQNNTINVLREMNRKLDDNLKQLRVLLDRKEETEKEETK